VSVARLEQRLATLLSTSTLSVGTGVAQVGGASTAAAVSIAGVMPCPQFATRLPAELLPHTPQRVSAVTVRAVLTVGAAAGQDGRAAALEAATVLWWRCEDGPVATGSGFPAGDLTEGYRVLEVRPVGWTTPEAPEESGEPAPAPCHRIALDVDALVWPRTAAPQAGDLIGPILIRSGGALSGAGPVRVAAGASAEIVAEVDLRSFTLHPRAPGDPAPLPREVTVAVVPLGDTAAGSVTPEVAPVTGDRVAVTYTAGASRGRDVLRFAVVPDGAPPFMLGSGTVEVTG
jgi:hypothetical protein